MLRPTAPTAPRAPIPCETRPVPAPKSPGQILQELWQLLQDYAKQETVDPLRNLGRYLGYGIGGAVLIGTGVFFLALSALRALQTETDLFADTWSFLPYVIVALGLAAVAGLSVWAIGRTTGEERP